MKYGFGIDLGGTTVKLAWFNESGEMLHNWEIPTRRENNGANILPDIAAAALGYLAEQNIPREDILGIGIGVPGPVDPNGVVSACVNLGWGRTDIPKTLGGLMGLRVVAGNDANVAALGECWKGGGRGCDNMVMVTLGTGVGGGIVVGGRVIHGVHGAGGEIGHFCVNPNETRVCGCGNRGCVEQYCSATGVVRLAKDRLAASNTPSALRQMDNFTCKDVFDLAAKSDPVAVAALAEFYDYLGRALSTVSCVADPEIFVLGGGVSKAGTPLLKGVQESYLRYSLFACKDTKFALATLGNDAGAYGAFRMLLS